MGKFYLKKLLATIISLSIITPTGINIFSKTNIPTTNAESNERQIVDAINGTQYVITIISGGNTKNITNQITSNFIKNQLTNEVAKTFNGNLFHFNKVRINGRDLNDQDLATNKNITTKINYNYGDISVEETNLVIIIVDKIIDQNIISEINQTTYQIKTIKGNTSENITKQITGEFMQKQLTSDIAKTFNYNDFTFNKITVNGNELNDNNLKISQTLNAKINYNYGSINIIQETNLIIDVVETITNQDIVAEINQTTYQITTILNNNAKNINDKITAQLIQNQLTSGIKTAFDPNIFHFNRIIIDGRDLTDDDLTTIGTINAKINYNYGSITNQATNLTIKVTTEIDDNQIVNTINNINFQTEVAINSKASNIKITAQFIQEQLTNEIVKVFNIAKFKFNKITINNKELKDSDLTTSGTLNTKINYNYGSITNQVTNLTIKVTTNNNDEQNINNAIKNHLYQGTALINTTISNLLSLISTNDFGFIKNGLPEDLQSKFQTQYFEFGKVYLGNRELQDSDLTVVHNQNNPLNIQVEFKYPNSNVSYDRFNAKLIIIADENADDKYRIVQEELFYINARDIDPNSKDFLKKSKNRTYEQIKTILDNHGLEFNQEQWIVDWTFHGLFVPYMIIAYLSFPTFERQIAFEIEKNPLETNFNNSVQEALKDYQFQDLANYEQEIKNIITTIKEKLNPNGNSIYVSDWKITKKEGYIEVHYQLLGLVWLYEPIQVPYN